MWGPTGDDATATLGLLALVALSAETAGSVGREPAERIAMVWTFFGSEEPGAGIGAGARGETNSAVGTVGASPTESDPSELIATMWIFFGCGRPGSPAGATGGTDSAVGCGGPRVGAGAGANGATAADPGAPSKGALEFGEIGIVEPTCGAVFDSPCRSSG